uniref:Uncharacterized protein n=1 Tax=Meloidogyne enterolobii TaxID=390850 RepID=A0A6V7V0A2_MELEN|nr:unnamed protein product [Meloidogyne enterolobii]
MASDFWRNFRATEMSHEEHFNDWKTARNSILSNISQHKQIYTSGDKPKFYRAKTSYLTLKKANEGLSPIELIKSKFNGTIRLVDKNKEDKSNITNKNDDKN